MIKYENEDNNLIEIPQIQRDYAQGREGEKYYSIRQNFLKDIKRLLDMDNKNKEYEKSKKLFYIYGIIKDKKFNPLDGQQRLTTLWLIHWYIGFRTGLLWENGELSQAGKSMKNFTYETRVSSREFCMALCDEMNGAKLKEEETLAEYITSRTWFYSAWLQDPTIDAMLRMLSGEAGREGDCIEKVFGTEKNSKLKNYWEKFTGQENIITFKRLTITNDELPFPDDLYIKMNARGKTLTDFENFKTDFMGYIKRIKGEGAVAEKLCLAVDTAWTDVFWKDTSPKLGKGFKGYIDEIFFSFINRYVLNKIVLNEAFKAEWFKNSSEKDDKNEVKSFFDKIYATEYKGEDSKVSYDGFDEYEKYLDESDIDVLSEIFTQLSKEDENVVSVINQTLGELKIQDSIDDELEEELDDEEASDINEVGTSIIDVDTGEKNKVNSKKNRNASKINFIPEYIVEDNDYVKEYNTHGRPIRKIYNTSLKNRIYFYAICAYLSKDMNNGGQGGFEQHSFKRWMRVVRNIVENVDLTNIPNTVSRMREIKQLAEGCGDIYSHLVLLKSKADKVSSYLENANWKVPERNLYEEMEKAERIVNHPEEELLINEAEDYGFFDGTISFLYHNENGDIDWSQFGEKLKAAKSLFDNNAINRIHSDREKAFEVVKKFLNLCDDFKLDACIFHDFGYSARGGSWKRDIFWKESFKKEIHMLLEDANASDIVKGDGYEKFLGSKFLKQIFDYSAFNNKFFCKRIGAKKDDLYYNHLALRCNKQQYGFKIGVLKDNTIVVRPEYAKLHQLVIKGKITIDDEEKNPYCEPFYWGLDIRFSFNGQNYILDTYDKVSKVADKKITIVADSLDEFIKNNKLDE